MNFLIYSCETESFDSYLSMLRRLPGSPASGEFIAQRNIRFRPIDSALPTWVTEKLKPKRVQRNGRKGARRKTMPSNANRSGIQSRIPLRNFLFPLRWLPRISCDIT
jgi:hypothetical protein